MELRGPGGHTSQKVGEFTFQSDDSLFLTLASNRVVLPLSVWLKLSCVRAHGKIGANVSRARSVRAF